MTIINSYLEDRIICISGGFDSLHAGHVRLIQGCQNFGKVIAILNSDKWVKNKHGFVLMPWEDRKEVLMAIKGVSEVVPVDDSDGTVCEALKRIKPHIFANGGSRVKGNTPERQICEELGITMIWGIGGGEREQYVDHIKDLVIKLNKKRKK